MDIVDRCCRRLIYLCEQALAQKQIEPALHIEYEGCVALRKGQSIDFDSLNQQLRSSAILAELKPEYWRGQWEYASCFAGQSPLRVADDLVNALEQLPRWFRQQNIDGFLNQPVVWHGDRDRVVAEGEQIRSAGSGSVHIPNAVQLNLSAWRDGTNLVAESDLGERLQYQLLRSSYDNCLLFLPEEDAFERLLLKSRYQLQKELSSPVDLSGGHNGSIALYRELGKHNQRLGARSMVVDQRSAPLLESFEWQRTARVEHRLGASSVYYSVYLNTLFGLLNLLAAVNSAVGQYQTLAPKALPASLEDGIDQPGAVSLFRHSYWLEQQVDGLLFITDGHALTEMVPQFSGSWLKNAILERYQPLLITQARH